MQRLVLRPREVWRALARRRRAGLAEAEHEHLVDLLTIDAVGERDPEVARAQPFRDLGVLVVALIAEEPDVGALIRRVQVHAVVAPLLVFQQHRQLADVDVASLRVVLAGDRAQVDELQVLPEGHPDAVDVGELVAFRVHPDAVGVALQDPRRRVDRRHGLPGRHHRQVGVAAGVVAALEEQDPVLELRVGQLLCEVVFRGVLRMELLEVMGGGEAAQRVPPEAGVVADAPDRGEHRGQRVVGIRRDELHGAGVDLLHGDRLAVDAHHRQRRGHDLLVRVDVLEPEHEVVGGERGAVAPLHAAAQVHRGDFAVGADLPAAGDVGHESGARVVEEEQLVVLGGAVAVGGVERPREAAPPGPAVLADLAQRLDDERVLADALLYGRELAGFHQLGELRGLLERLGIAGGVGDDFGALQLADEIGAGLGALRERPRHEAVG